jgi:hypothetical protein
MRLVYIMDRGRFLLYPGIIMLYSAGLLYFILHGIIAEDFAGVICYISITLIMIGVYRKSMKLVNLAIVINLITFINDILLVLTDVFRPGMITSNRGQTTLGLFIILIDVALFFIITFMLLSIPFRDKRDVFRRKSVYLVLGLVGIRFAIYFINGNYAIQDFLSLLVAFLDFLLLILAILGAILCVAAFPYDKKKRLQLERETQAHLINAAVKMLEFWKVNYREMTKAEMVRDKICTIDKCGAMIRVLHETVTLPDPIPRDIIKGAQDVIKRFETPNLLDVLRALNRSVHFLKQIGKYLVDNKFIDSFPYYIEEETTQASSSAPPEPLAIDSQSVLDVAVPIDSDTPIVINEQISTETNDKLTGLVYICPECGQKYRLSQAKELAQSDGNCFACNTPIVLD